MLKIERTNDFKRDFKRELRGRFSKTVDADLLEVLGYLMHGPVIAAKIQRP